MIGKKISSHTFACLLMLSLSLSASEGIARTWIETKTGYWPNAYKNEYYESDFIIDGIAYKLFESSLTAIVTPFYSCYSIYYTQTKEEIISLDYYFNQNGKSYSGEVVIPEKVKWRGKTYTVIAVETHAFDNCYNMTNLVIPASVHYDFGYWFRTKTQDASSNYLGFYQEKNNNFPRVWFDYSYNSDGVQYHDPFPWLMNQPVGTIIYVGDRVEAIFTHSLKNRYRTPELLEDVKIKEGTTVIEDNVGKRLYALKLTLPSTLKRIGSYAFSGSNLLDVYCNIPTPADVADPTAFDKIKDIATLYVPQGTLHLYNTLPWSNFPKIVERLTGDVDGNNIINGSDVTSLYELLLNGNNGHGEADVDGNGVVNGSDVTALYDLLLQ